MHRIPLTVRPVLIRLFIFLTLFLGVTGIVGPTIVASNLLYGYGFFIYGNMGKLVILMALVFPLFIKERIPDIPKIRWHNHNFLFAIASALCLAGFFPLSRITLLQTTPNSFSFLNVLCHAVLLAVPLFCLLAIFGVQFLSQFVKTYKKEIGICVTLGTVLYLAIFQVWKLWPIFSHGVLTSVSFLFGLTFEKVRVIPPRILVVDSFAVRIEQACSGIDSLFLFTSMYSIIGFIERKTLIVSRYIVSFVIAAIGLYLVNILRVYLIILYGVLVSPDTAIKLFHTYAGMVLFIIYFALFLRLCYPWIRKSNTQFDPVTR